MIDSITKIDEVMPNSEFFKYMTSDVADIVLGNRTLRWSTPRTFNDPFDVQFDLRAEFDLEELTRLALQKLWESFYEDGPLSPASQYGNFVNAVRDAFPRFSREEFDEQYSRPIKEGAANLLKRLPEVQEELRDHMSTSKILCLTKVMDSMLMWSHYADSHQGVVLGFKTAPNFDSPWRMAKAVTYSADMPALIDANLLSDVSAGRATLDPRQIMERFVYTKSTHWEYEQEWRIWAGDGRNRDAPFEDIEFHHDELDVVVLGCRMSDERRKYFREFVATFFPEVGVFQAIQAKDSFSIMIEKLSDH